MQRRDLFKIGAVAATASFEPLMAQTPSAAPDWKPAVFDAHQNETVIALTELIIPATDTPGAKAALVNRYLDLFLKDGDPAQREAFLAGLSWTDGYAIRKHNTPFVKLTPAQQTAILTAFDAYEEVGIEPGHQFFRQLKSMTARIYYNTAIGYRELNKGGRVPRTFACS
jgi:hypothetical protein